MPFAQQRNTRTTTPPTPSPTNPDNTDPGPTSTNPDTPDDTNTPTPSANRTAPRTCPTQYSGEHNSPTDAKPPDTPDTTANRGTRYTNPRATSPNSPNIGSTKDE